MAGAAAARTKHIVVTGGVISGLGKGVAAASLARLLAARGLRVAMGKMDPYLNIDPGTLSPAEHGETFVLESGTEVDLDFGHYERFSGEEMPAAATITAGSVYQQVLSAERRGDYLGHTVQVVPHIVDAIRDRMLALSEPASGPRPDVAIFELGGTVGDMESLAFLEAIRRYRHAVGRRDFALVHLALVAVTTPAGEAKTKPLQHSVVALRSTGLSPDVILARSGEPLGAGLRAKIACLCDVDEDCVISASDADSLYEIPLRLHAGGLDDVLCARLGLDTPPPDLDGWRRVVARALRPSRQATVGVAAKYGWEGDAYLSVAEALNHAGIAADARVRIRYIAADALPGTPAESLEGLDALVIPGGFGARGIEGKIALAGAARAAGLPTLGLCLGMQVMVVEAARSLAGLAGAGTTEADPGTPHPVVSLMGGQREAAGLGGTMRLGAYPAVLAPGSRAAALYGRGTVSERHRHRYEVDGSYTARLAAAGLLVSATSPDGSLVEMVELAGDRFYVGTQAHPEFRSRPDRPHPLFAGLLAAALARQGAPRAPRPAAAPRQLVPA